MARLARLYAPALVQYVAQRPAAGRVLFADDEDYLFFTSLLGETVRTAGVALHAYALMPSQVRFLATPSEAGSIGRLMQSVGRRYVAHVNRRSRRTGPLWDRRYRSTLIDADAFLLPSMRHVEQSPVVADATADASQWRWSSAAHHVGLGQQPFLTDHRLYWALSDAPFERQAIYRGLIDVALEPALALQIEQAVDRGWLLGHADFVERTRASVNRRPTPLRRGRPRK